MGHHCRYLAQEYEGDTSQHEVTEHIAKGHGTRVLEDQSTGECEARILEVQ